MTVYIFICLVLESKALFNKTKLLTAELLMFENIPNVVKTAKFCQFSSSKSQLLDIIEEPL